jgi:hypothetical protein
MVQQAGQTVHCVGSLHDLWEQHTSSTAG